MIKYGLEKEFFLKKTDGTELLVIPVPKSIPYDESGCLVEARGKPYNNIRDAVFSLMSEINRIEYLLPNGMKLDDYPVYKITKQQKFAVRREFTKGVNSYQNLYGYEYHKTSYNEHTASVHISFTDEQSYINKDNIQLTYNKLFDYVQLFRYLDNRFAYEIKQAKRRPGFYEIKPDGRIEYRSLPSNVKLQDIITVINDYKWS